MRKLNLKPLDEWDVAWSNGAMMKLNQQKAVDPKTELKKGTRSVWVRMSKNP